MSFSFDESDDEMRRIRTNSRGRTQNIFRRTRKSDNQEQGLGDTDSDGARTSPESPDSPQPSTPSEDLNRYI